MALLGKERTEGEEYIVAMAEKRLYTGKEWNKERVNGEEQAEEREEQIPLPCILVGVRIYMMVGNKSP